jgi:hypothetical protein
LIKYTVHGFGNGADAGGVHLFTNLSDLDASILANPDQIEGKIREMVTSASGLELRGYLETIRSATAWWGSAGVRLNGARASETADSETIPQFKASLGGEFRLSSAYTEAPPVSISAEAIYGHILSDRGATLLELTDRALPSLEGTLIIPAAAAPALRVPFLQNTALLIQGVFGLNEAVPSFWRVAIVIANGN